MTYVTTETNTNNGRVKRRLFSLYELTDFPYERTSVVTTIYTYHCRTFDNEWIDKNILIKSWSRRLNVQLTSFGLYYKDVEYCINMQSRYVIKSECTWCQSGLGRIHAIRFYFVALSFKSTSNKLLWLCSNEF